LTAASLVPRPDLEDALLEGAAGARPVLLSGPRGSGKTTLLQQAAERLSERGWEPIYLDLFGAASSPELLLQRALATLPSRASSLRGAAATAVLHLHELAARGRQANADAVHALFAAWAALDEIDGRPVALLLDDVTEIRSLAYFAGLRDVHVGLGQALSARPRGTVVASSFSRVAHELWPDWTRVEARAFTVADLAALGGSAEDAELLVRASFGIARYLHILLDAKADGRDVLSAWIEGMALGGRLEQAARHTYEALLLRSRGYGMSKAVLATVAEEEGLNLTALVARLGRSPGAVRDYLGWLLAVDALRFSGKRYFYADGLVRQWARLHGRGTVGTASEITRAARELLMRETPDASVQSSDDALAQTTARSPVPARDQTLMEMD
jgi:hypothetical protein